MGQHLHADHRQHDRQRDLQVAELVDHARQREVERPQPEDGEDVAGEDEERVGGDREDGGDRVDGEDQVGGLDHDQRQHERREHRALPVRRDRTRQLLARDSRGVIGQQLAGHSASRRCSCRDRRGRSS